MNARRLEIARRLVACKGWVWLPGMVALRLDGGEVIVRIRIEIIDEGCAVVRHERYGLRGMIPALSDDLTRLGVLAVVRRACGHLACVESPAVSGLLRLSTDSAPWRVHFRGGIAIGDTEEEALLSALESAS